MVKLYIFADLQQIFYRCSVEFDLLPIKWLNYLPFLPLPRTPSRLSSFRSTDGRTGTDRTCDRTRRCLRTIFSGVCGEGGSVCRGARTTTSFGPQRELPPAKLVIHRTNL